eukprot:GHVT01018883.1.p1 GENE.GHVT01018883.1~~GHVT01018883.1.p1  ORF type:complete len:220 (+),score=51.58 GHVT01018883.1:202-861(+)
MAGRISPGRDGSRSADSSFSPKASGSSMERELQLLRERLATEEALRNQSTSLAMQFIRQNELREDARQRRLQSRNKKRAEAHAQASRRREERAAAAAAALQEDRAILQTALLNESRATSEIAQGKKLVSICKVLDKLEEDEHEKQKREERMKKVQAEMHQKKENLDRLHRIHEGRRQLLLQSSAARAAQRRLDLLSRNEKAQQTKSKLFKQTKEQTKGP